MRPNPNPDPDPSPNPNPDPNPNPNPDPNPNPNPDPSPDPDPDPNPNPHQVLDAAAPWSPATHALWPPAKRRRAAELLRLGQQLSLLPFFAGEEQALRDLWRTSVMPAALER